MWKSAAIFTGIIATLLVSFHEIALVSLKKQAAALEHLRLDKDANIRFAHARELLGPDFKRKLPKIILSHSDLSAAISYFTETNLRKLPSKERHKVAQAILRVSRKRGFDPVLILAVIQRESRFDPTLVGSHGEIGLMQLRPPTAAWIAHKCKLPWRGPSTLRNPVMNIRIGTAYLSMLRRNFRNRSRLYLSAYNWGPTKLRENRMSSSIYAGQVTKNYETLQRRIGEIKLSLHSEKQLIVSENPVISSLVYLAELAQKTNLGSSVEQFL